MATAECSMWAGIKSVVTGMQIRAIETACVSITRVRSSWSFTPSLNR